MYKVVAMTNILYFDTLEDAVRYIEEHRCEDFKIERLKIGGEIVIKVEDKREVD